MFSVVKPSLSLPVEAIATPNEQAASSTLFTECFKATINSHEIMMSNEGQTFSKIAKKKPAHRQKVNL